MNERWEQNAVKQRHAREELRAKELAVIDAARALYEGRRNTVEAWDVLVDSLFDAVRALDQREGDR